MSSRQKLMELFSRDRVFFRQFYNMSYMHGVIHNDVVWSVVGNDFILVTMKGYIDLHNEKQLLREKED